MTEGAKLSRMVTGGFGRKARLGLGACFVAVACGAKSTRTVERSAEKGGEAGTEGSVGGSAGVETGGSSSTTGGVPAGGAITSGRGGSGASSGTGGTGALGGTQGEAGGGGLSGEGGSPVDPCTPGDVRCVVRRERCSDEGEWADEEFDCTSQVSGSTEFPVACAVKATGRFTCFGPADNDLFASRMRLGAPPVGLFDVDVADEVTSNTAVCGLAEAGVVFCWGETGGSGGGVFVRVATSQEGTCGITETFGLYCPTGSQMLPPPPDAGPFVDLDMSNGHLYAVRRDGSVYVTQDFTALPAGKYVQVSAGGENACGIRDDGTLGCNNGIVVPEVLVSERFTRIAVEYFARVCGIRPDGTIRCFNGRTDTPPLEPFDPPEGAFTKITATSSGMCAIRDDGSLACWGDNPFAPPEGW